MKQQHLSATFEGIRKSGRVIYAFTQFYLPFYRVDVPVLYYDFDLFGGVSAAIYDIDDKYESPDDGSDSVNHFAGLVAFLKARGYVDDTLERLFGDARRYYAFEQSMLLMAEYDLSDLVETWKIRSFDFRVLHRILVQRLQRPYDEAVFTWFRAFEQLMELEDDLLSIEADKLCGTFNVYCLAERLLGNEPAVSQFVDGLRQGVESELNAGLSYLNSEDAYIGCQILRDYRRIVPQFAWSPQFMQSLGERASRLLQ